MSAQAKSVKVTVQIGDVTVPVNSLTLRHTINSLPMAEFTTQLSNHGTSGSTEMSMTEFQKLNVLTQQKFYNNFSIVPDTAIQVTDGDGNTITFNGFLMQTSMRIISGKLTLVFAAIHVGAALQAFNGSVYNTQAYYLAQPIGQYFAGTDSEELGPPGLLSQLETLPALNDTDDAWTNYFTASGYDTNSLFSDAEPPRTNSISHRIYAVVNGLHTDALKNTKNQNTEIQQALNISVLNANTAVLPYIKHLMMGSLATTLITGLTDFGTDPSNLTTSDSPLLQTIYDILTDAPNFLAAALDYIQPFLFQLNANWSGSLAFEPNQFTQNPGKRLIQAPIEDITFTLAGAHKLPLAQVIVLYPAEEFYAYGGNMGINQVPMSLLGASMEQNSGMDVIPQNFDLARLYGITTGFENISFLGDTLRYLAKYPPTPVVPAGQYLTLVAPSWTYPTSYTAKDMLNPGTEGQNRFAAASDNALWSAGNLQGRHFSRLPILEYLAKATYESLVLQRTSAFLNIPLSLKAQVGRTYTAASMEGAAIYQGYLRGVTHTIVLGEDGGMATTALDFSHIIANGARLTGINDMIEAQETVPVDDV